MRYFWDYMFNASDRAYLCRDGGQFDPTVETLIRWHEEEEEKKYMREHQGDNMTDSNC